MRDIRARLLEDVTEDRPAQIVFVDDALALLVERGKIDGGVRSALDLLAEGKIADALARIEAAARGDEPSRRRAASQMWRVAGFVAGPSDAARSAADFEAALRLQPDDETARFGLGVAQARLGHKVEARATFSSVLFLTKDEPAFFYQYWAGVRSIDLALLAHDGANAAAAIATLRARLGAEIATDPAKRIWMRDLATSLHILGARSTAHHDAAAALATQKDALGIIETLAAAAGPTDRYLGRDLAVSREILAEAEMRAGDNSGALAGYESALAIFRKLVDAMPTDVILRKDVARVDEAAAGLMIERARYDDAKRLLLESIGTANWLGRVYKEDGRDWVEDLARREEALADMLQDKTEDHAGAVNWFDALRSVTAWMTRVDPTDRHWRLKLAVAYRKLGIARDLAGSHKEATDSYGHALAVGLKLVADDPADAAGQVELASLYEWLGARARLQHAREAALAAFKEAVAIRTRVSEKTPGDPSVRHALALADEKLADVLDDGGDRAAALRAYQAAAAIYDALLAAAPNDPMRLRDAGVAHNEVGCAELKAGDKAAAIAEFRRRHAVFDRAAAVRADDAETQQEFVMSYDQLLDALRSAGRPADATELVATSRARMADVARRHPQLGKALAAIAQTAAADPKP